MKYALPAVVLLVGLLALPTFLPSEAARARAETQGFSASQIERGETYARERNVLYWTGTLVNLVLLTILAFRGRALADGLSRLVRGAWLPTVLLVTLACSAVEEAVNLPLGLVRLEHLRAWGLTQRGVIDWLGQHFLALGIFAGVEGLLLVGLFVLVRLLPRTWWLIAWLGTTLFGMAGAFLLPLVIAPLFNTFTPLQETKYAGLEPMVRRLLDRAHVTVGDILVVDASRQSGHTNAYFTGFGGSKRIVLYDTLLEKNSADEVETILAHELGHWLHDHIVFGIVLGSAGCLAGFGLLALIWPRLVASPTWQLRSLHDPAGVPLLLLVMTLASWLVTPLESAVSRHFERQADAVSLELTGKTAAFIEAERKLALHNISNLAPHPLAVFLYHSHPPAVERMQMAHDWPDGY